VFIKHQKITTCEFLDKLFAKIDDGPTLSDEFGVAMNPSSPGRNEN
jgi:hypothetical protein